MSRSGCTKGDAYCVSAASAPQNFTLKSRGGQPPRVHLVSRVLMATADRMCYAELGLPAQ